MRRAVAAVLFVLVLAGCSSPAMEPVATAPADTATAPPGPVYEILLRISEEAADGPAVANAVVFVVQKGQTSLDPHAQPQPLRADEDGFVRLRYGEPIDLVVQAVAPAARSTQWTREGAHVHVGEDVTTAEALVVSERTVFIPLYRRTLDVDAAATWMPDTAGLLSNGAVDAKLATAPLALPDAPGYAVRLAKATVTLAWSDTPERHGGFAAGLAWDGATWVEGDAQPVGVLPSEREAEWKGDLPARPEGATQLQAAAIAHGPIVGDVPLAFHVRLEFAGNAPKELPPPSCLSTQACGVPSVLPP